MMVTERALRGTSFVAFGRLAVGRFITLIPFLSKGMKVAKLHPCCQENVCCFFPEGSLRPSRVEGFLSISMSSKARNHEVRPRKDTKRDPANILFLLSLISSCCLTFGS